MTQVTIHRTSPIPARRVPGFTVVELLVAIAVLAVISVGLSVIFGTVGDAVTDGRRVSELNRASARIEQQIRDDLAGLTRDGFLVITNRYASDENGRIFSSSTGFNTVQPGVSLSPRDSAGRARRADEMMFFARGDFETNRPPVSAGVSASSSEAAIYYGIGQKRPINILADNVDSAANYYFNPSPRDSNLISDRLARYPALLGLPEPPGQLPNPNRYASDWSLLRQVTLLAEPQIVSVLPERLYGLQRTRLADRTLMLDSARQIGMQPAARSIFNSLSWTDSATYAGAPGSVPADGLSRWWVGDIADYGGGGGGLSPADASLPAWRSSGVVDIAQGSILGIRRQIEALSVFGPPSSYYAPSGVNPFSTRPARFANSADGFAFAWNNHAASPRPLDAKNLNIIGNATHRSNLRAWALDMLPSLWNGESNPPTFLAGVRYEDLPTRLVYDDNRFPNSNAGRLGRAISESNQEMLTSQIFVPRCSEFIVEWSYGFVDVLPPNDPRFKQLKWYGLPRADRDVNNDGRVELDDHAVVAAQIAQRYFPRTVRPANTPPDPDRRHVALGLLDASLTNPEVVVFGLTDPKGSPGGGEITVPWPRYIRITMSLADPDDETLERSYQFVFAVPGEQN